MTKESTPKTAQTKTAGSGLTLREELLNEMLHPITATEDNRDYTRELYGQLIASSALRKLILDNRCHPLIAERNILGALLPRARPVVQRLISNLLTCGGGTV